MDSTYYIYHQDAITCIKTVNKNITIPNNKSEQKYVILQGVINGIGRKTVQKSSTGKVKDGREKKTKTNQQVVTQNVDFP